MSKLPKRLERNESMLFSYGSTYKTDYNDGEIPHTHVKTEYKDHIHHKPRPKYKPLKDTHAMTDYRDANVPFTMFWDWDPILRKPFKNIEKPNEGSKEHEREEAQRTRPRVILTPAYPIDNIVDKTARKLFCEDMYTSEKERGLRNSIPVYFNVKAPYPGTNAPPRPITLPKWSPALVSSEWRMESVKQDSKQFRAYCDPTKEFWLRFPIYDCRTCKETKIAMGHRRKECLKKNTRPPFKV